MSELINVHKMGQEILDQLKDQNKKIWDAISFRMIHALMSEEAPLKDSYQKTQEYRQQRWEKALKQTKGDIKKAYQLIVSEEFN